MTDPQQLAQDFLNALSSNDPARYEAVLSEEVGMRLNRWDGREIYRPRKRVMQRFIDEWSSWPDPSLEGFEIVATGDRVALEFRIQATENDRYVEHNRSAFLTIKDDQDPHHRSVLPGTDSQCATQKLDRTRHPDR